MRSRPKGPPPADEAMMWLLAIAAILGLAVWAIGYGGYLVVMRVMGL